MDKQMFERRRLLRAIALGSLALAAVALPGCASNPEAYRRQRRWWQHDGGGDGADKAGSKR